MQHTTFTFRSVIKLFTTLFLVAFAASMYAQASLSVQGVLTKSDGTAVDDGTYTITFKLFDAATGGNEVHSEPIDIETIGGVYSTVLGQNPGFPMTAPFNTIYYLSVRVGSSELLPRPQLTHSPYALSLLGQSNQFPSSGQVKADYIVVPGGDPAGGVAGKGYSFGAGGDQDGGMFSNGDNNVSLWANGTKKIEISNTSNILYGATATNDLTINGTAVVNGNIRANSFSTNPTFNTGMYPNGNSEVILKTNGNNRVWCGTNLAFDNNDKVYINANSDIEVRANNGGSNFNVYAVTHMRERVFAEGMLLSGNGGLGVFYDQNSKELTAKTSSRRFKTNIQPFEDNFKLILKAQPKIYTRPGSPDPNATEIGYIAEEMDSLGLQQLVIYDNEGKEFSLHYDLLPVYNLEILKMHEVTINELQAQVEALKLQNAQLQSTNTTLNASLEKQKSEFSAQLSELSKRMKLIEISNVAVPKATGEK